MHKCACVGRSACCRSLSLAHAESDNTSSMMRESTRYKNCTYVWCTREKVNDGFVVGRVGTDVGSEEEDKRLLGLEGGSEGDEVGELRGGKVGFAVAFALLPFFEKGKGELWLGGVVAVMGVWGAVRSGEKIGWAKREERERWSMHGANFGLTANKWVIRGICDKSEQLLNVMW